MADQGEGEQFSLADIMAAIKKVGEEIIAVREEIRAVKEESAAVREKVRGQIEATTCKLLEEMNVLRSAVSDRHSQMLIMEKQTEIRQEVCEIREKVSEFKKEQRHRIDDTQCMLTSVEQSVEYAEGRWFNLKEVRQEIRALQAVGEEMKEEMKEETRRDLEKAKISAMELRKKSTSSETTSEARVTTPDLTLVQPDTRVGSDSPHASPPPSPRAGINKTRRKPQDLPQVYVKQAHITDLQEALARALEYESFRMSGNSGGVQVYPGVQQAFRARCTQVRRRSNSPRTGDKCWRYGHQGHQKQYCTKAKIQSTEDVATGYRYQPCCWSCGEQGHLSKKCPKQSAGNDGRLEEGARQPMSVRHRSI
ncbi:uncharacterized protein [Penaeus vannamei]|uniref:uncharacterized protein n=1 Tax=Penaeus vannamei TaxID=6689 RepID=UPI000F666A64|nr:eukaryotic translation initiation factor 3 subunit A-like [Penaeus vannamei]